MLSSVTGCLRVGIELLSCCCLGGGWDRRNRLNWWAYYFFFCFAPVRPKRIRLMTVVLGRRLAAVLGAKRPVAASLTTVLKLFGAAFLLRLAILDRSNRWWLVVGSAGGTRGPGLGCSLLKFGEIQLTAVERCREIKDGGTDQAELPVLHPSACRQLGGLVGSAA